MPDRQTNKPTELHIEKDYRIESEAKRQIDIAVLKKKLKTTKRSNREFTKRKPHCKCNTEKNRIKPQAIIL